MAGITVIIARVKSRILLALLVCLVAGGCVHSRRDLPASQAGENRDYRIVESVYDEEWKPVSLLTVLDNGRYLWVVRDVWSVPPRDHTFSGVLSVELLEELHQEEEAFTLVAGERVYVIRAGEGDEVPAGIQAVMGMLRTTHFSGQ